MTYRIPERSGRPVVELADCPGRYLGDFEEREFFSDVLRLAERAPMGGYTGRMTEWFLPGGPFEQPHRLVVAIDMILAEISAVSSHDSEKAPSQEAPA